MPDPVKELRLTAARLSVGPISNVVLDDPRFPVWSGSSKPFMHHYGQGGLAQHTLEVADLCLSNVDYFCGLGKEVDRQKMFLAALFHDSGKMWDYAPARNPATLAPDYQTWESTEHKRQVHHITRSALLWGEAKAKFLPDQTDDDVLHAILAHHQLRQWGSPVMPNSRMAWVLHLCDNLSARVDDVVKWDRAKTPSPG